MSTFSIAAIDELYVRGALVERRLMHGRAEEREGEIFATDARDDALVAACEEAIAELRRAVPADARVRLVARACPTLETSMTVKLGGVSIVAYDAADVELLRTLVATSPTRTDVPTLPIVWRNGSAAVLLHEAIGHPLELDIPAIEWPPWLRVECPLELRRESFRDVPLRRMHRLVASQEGAPFAMPERRIDVHLVRGGAYDPLTDVVTIDVTVADAEGERLAPFTLRATRERIAQSLLGATGEPLRYPGVVCSREGQELVVGSFAPLMVTEALA